MHEKFWGATPTFVLIIAQCLVQFGRKGVSMDTSDTPLNPPLQSIHLQTTYSKNILKQ